MANGFSRDRLARLHHALAAHVSAGDMPGVVALVSRHGEVHVEAVGTLSFGGAPMMRDTIFRIASMTKPVIAAATLMLVEEGKLRLDDPVDASCPNWPTARCSRRSTARSRTRCRRGGRSPRATC